MANYRVVFGRSGNWAHSFGHDPILKGLIAAGQTRPAHLVLTLDTRDPRLAVFGLDVGPRLRLVHPFFFSQGDRFAYHHAGQDEIAFPDRSAIRRNRVWHYRWQLAGDGPADYSRLAPVMNESRDPFALLETDWPSANFPDVIPAMPIDLEEVEIDPDTYATDLEGVDPIYLGSSVPTMQDYEGCVCSVCSSAELRLIASVPSKPLPSLDIWENCGVFVLFWYCLSCKAIITHNECD